MKKLLTLVVLLGLCWFAHSKGWFTVNAEKAKADLREIVDKTLAKGGETLDKAKRLGHKDCAKNKELSESNQDTLEKSGLRE